ncbi:MAG: ParB/RepB/Spo0J family partition protein [Smithella sp.]|jgi:ParB/RepB/Spo0J family partition protein
MKKTGNGKQYQEVTLADIQVNPDNPRKNFTGPKFDELVASVKKVGVMQPITIRPIKGKVPYMIVFGERRYNASVLIAKENGGIKKNSIPAIVRELTDDEAFELMTIENLQREDLTELEEAQSFKTYLDKKGKEALPELAERTGIKPSYIHRRVAVLGLPKEVLKAWDQGKIKYGHCEQLVRVADKNKMLELFNEVVYQSEWDPMTVKDLKDQIESDAIKLAVAKFDIEKAGCKKCRNNSDVQRKLFDEEIGKSLCLDPKCFKQNQNNWFMANWEREFSKKTGTNRFRFTGDVDYNKKHDFESYTGKPGAKCKECSYFVSFINIEGELRQKQSCVGDKSCYNMIIAAGKQEAKKKALAKAKNSSSGEQENTGEETSIDIPRVAWHGGFFIEEFYKTAIPEHMATLTITSPLMVDMALRFSLISLMIANDSLRREFLVRWMPEKYHFNEDREIIDQDNKNVSYWDIPPDKIWVRLLFMKGDELVEAHKEAAAQAIMQQNKTQANMRHYVAMHLGIDLAKEWRLTKEYLDKKTTKECLDLIDRLGISTDEKALAYLHETLNKKRGKFNSCKKAELVSLVMESGADLAGKVPDEILTAAKKLEKSEED